MTVGIGVCCGHGKCVVMAADAKGSSNDGSFPSHEKLGKQHDLPFRLCGNIAGVVEIANAVMNRLATALELHPRNMPLQLDFVIKSAEAARFAEFKRTADAEMKKRLGITLEEWQGMPQATLLYRRGDRIIRHSGLPVEILVGGVIFGSAAIVHFAYMDIARVDGLACIGTGGDAAYRQLMKRSQTAHMGLPRTILHVAEALREARIAKPETVGLPADYVIITENQTRRMPAKSPVLVKMLEKYADLDDTAELDSDGDVFLDVEAAMYSPGVTKEEYEQGLRAPGPRPLVPQRSPGRQ